LATVLLLVVAALLRIEHHAQRRMRFTTSRGGRAGAADAAPTVLHGSKAAIAWLVCALPIALGFVLPVLVMLRPLMAGWGQLPWAQFVHWSLNSVGLAGLSAALATALALGLAYAQRRQPDWLTRAAVQLASLGYAVPGAVIVVGLLLPVGWLQT